MRTLRIFFSKTGEAAYISHLDLQRVFSRALRISGLPVWYSQGFNPHIYMSFALPLPLMHQSLCEAVDVKTEDEREDFSAFVQPLSDALPRGITVARIALPVHKAEAITTAEYAIAWPDADALAAAVAGYNALAEAIVVRKTKRSERPCDLKTVLPTLVTDPKDAATLPVRLPAGGTENYNPNLLCGLLEAQFGLPAARALVTRISAWAGDAAFC